MANFSVSLTNLLKSLTNYSAAKSVVATTATSSATTNAKASVNTNVPTTTQSSVKSTTASTKTTAASSTGNLSKLLKNLSKKTSVLDNTTVITNDMETEFFKSYKNSIMTNIYNKLKNGSSFTASELENFKAQVAKLSADEQKLWKTEIANIQKQIEAKVVQTSSNANASSNAGSNNSNSGSNSGSNTAAQNNGFVSGVLYQNGAKFTGTYTDGKYYVNGVLANTTVNGKLYQNGVLFTGTLNGKNYKDGVAVSSATLQSANPVETSNIATKKTDSNGNILGYDKNGELVYLEKDVNGKKVVYDDELKYLNAKTLKYLTSVGDAVLNDRLLDDIEIVKTAEAEALKAGSKGTSAYNEAYNASIKSQMIKTTANAQNIAGEVVEKNGVLYVNNGSELVKLNISAETYLSLFPPVDRYDVNQNSISDCYFVSGCLTDMMKNGKTYAQVLQMFSEDASGNITVNFSGSLKSYPVTFQNGNLKVLDGMVDGKSVSKYSNASGSKGTQMLEQAYSIARFAQESGESLSTIDIDETISTIKGGWQYNVYKEVLNMSSERKTIYSTSVDSYLNSIASSVNSGKTLLSFASYGTVSEYNLTEKHAYSIESIDTSKKIVYITNPWFSGGSIAVPYAEFAKSAYTNGYIYFSEGKVGA